MAWRRPAVFALALAALCLVVYWPTINTGFIPVDDPKYVQENTAVTGGLKPEGLRAAFGLINNEFWLPVLQLSFMTDVTLFGTGPRGFHATNILLHAVNSALLFLVLLAATRSLWPSLLAAALFALHPMRVEAVAWITARKDLLSGLFFLLAVAAYLRRARTGGRLWLILSAVLLAFGLASKPILVTFPILMLLLDAWPLGRFRTGPSPRELWEGNRRLLVEKVPFLLLAAAFSLLTLLTQKPYIQVSENRFEWLDAMMRSAIAPFIYLYETVWPLSLGLRFEGLENIFWKVVGFGALALLAHLAILFALWRMRGRRPYLLSGWAWFLVALFPAGGIVPVGAQWVSDRFAYIPHMGLFAAAAWFAADLAGDGRWRKPVLAASLVAPAGLIALSAVQTTHWKDARAVTERAVAVAPDNPVAWRVLGDALDSSGADTTGAIAAYERALALFPGFADAHNNLGGMLVRMKRTSEGISQIEEALRLDPGHVEANNNLGAVLLDQGKPEEAIEHLTLALKKDPRHARAHANLGNALMDVGKVAEAMGHLTEAVRLQPGLADARNSLGAALMKAGKYTEAVEQLELAVRLKEGYPEAHNNLGLAMAGLSMFPEAAGQFAVAASLDAGNAQVLNNLGNALVATGKSSEALAHFQEALRIDPSYAEARSNLGMALYNVGNLPEALRQYGIALGQQPENAKIRVNYADALFASGRVPEAAGQYEKALSLGYETADVRNNLAAALSRVGRYREAVPHFERALELAPEDVGILMNLGMALRAAGRNGEAAEAYRKVLALSPGNQAARDHLAQLRDSTR